jgi:hypothetical protein
MASEIDNPLDAYQPPMPAHGETSQKKPGAGRVKAIAIISIVFGCLGVFSALGGIAGLVFGQRIQGAMAAPSQSGMPQEMVQAQKDMQADLMAVQDRFMPINAVVVALMAVVSVGLLIGGVQCLRRVVPARRVLLTACSAAIVFELLRAVVQVLIQIQTIPLTMRHTERMMSVGGGPAQAMEIAMTFARVFLVIGIVMGALWLLAKLIFFALSVWYLRQPVACSYLDGPASVDHSHMSELPQ